MIVFILFLFFWLGISFRKSIIVLGIVVSLLLIIIFIKYKKKIGFLCVGLTVLGVGLSYIRIDFSFESYSGLIIDSHDNYFIMVSRGEKLYTHMKNNEYDIGDYVSIKGEKEELNFVTLESQFDFKNYLNDKGVYYELKVEKIERGFANPIRIRERRKKFLSHFDENQKSFISALMFSEHNDDEALNDINKLHLARFSSASGIYIFAYLHFFEFILSYFIKNKKIKIVSLLTLFPYLIFTLPRFTIIRIILLEILRYINEAFLNKKFSSLAITGFGGFFFLIIDYHLAYQMSFILGFCIPLVFFIISDALSRFKRLKLKVLQLVFFYISFIPFELKFYNGINPLSLITQTLFTPFFILMGVLSLLCFYGVPIYGIVGFFLKGLTNILGWLGKISFQINGPPMNEWWLFFFFLFMVLICYYRSIDFKLIHHLLSIIFLFGLTFYFIPISNLITEQVSFINVGQGDSCLIRKGTTTVLIDTGGLSYTDLAKESLIPFMQKQRIYNVDLVILTHDDYDHTGAYDSLKENFYVKSLVTEASSFPISVGGITFNNYNNHTDSGEDNNKSLVVGFHLGNRDYLITGDAPKEIENKMMNEYDHIPCDILKVGHHGSNTSTSDTFIKYLSPKEGIISCGVNNRFGHPHKEVINILKNNNVVIRRTDVEGTITYRNYILM